ncbi:MAG: O-antigen ligase family protein [Anaerolineae bacterium]|nr:O-antigen ligase family protein [Anaerolineae bacterium]
MRKYIIFACSLAALLGSLTAVFASIAERDFMLRGYVDPVQDKNLPFRVSRLGVQAELTQYTSEELSQQLSLMQQAHITWVRQFFRWNEIEPQPGQYDWAQWDQIVEMVDQFPDLKLIAVLMNAPEWANNRANPTTPPDQVQDFAGFAGQFAARYGQSIDHYQVWDEPNLTAVWGDTPPRPAAYVALLEAAYAAIHNQDANATVIAAALAPTTEHGPDNISDVQFLDDLYLLGAGAYLDAAAAKPYGFNTSPEDRTVREDTLNFSRVILLREVMIKYGDGHKALWANNWGWNTLPDDWQGAPSIWGTVTADERIAYTLTALERVNREWPWLAGMTLHQWQPDAAPDDPQWGFSLIDQNDEPTPLWSALSQYTPSTAAENGLFFAANPYAEYSGVWSFGALGADIGWVNDSQLQFHFKGRDLALLLREDDYVAYLYPSVDGQQPNALPQDGNGHAYIILTSDTLRPELNLVPVATGLANSEHTLHIVTDELVPDEVIDRWAIAGYAVGSGDLALPYNRQIIIAIMTAVVAGMATLIAAWQIDWRQVFRPVAGLWQGIGQTGQLILSAATSVALMIGMLLTWNDFTPALFRREPVILIAAIASAGLIYIQPGLLLTVIALLVLFIIIYQRIDLGLALVVFWAPFFLFPIQLYTFAFPMAEILMLVTTAAWALHTAMNYGRSRQSMVSQYSPAVPALSKLTALDLGVLAWVVLSIISLLWMTYRAEAVTDLRVMTIEPALFYLVIRTTPLDKKSIIRLIDSLLLAGLLVALIGIWLYWQGDVITAEGGVRRLVSVYGSPNNVGLFLGRCLPFALSYLLIKTDRWRRIAAGFTFVVMVGAVALSQSAGALFIGVPVSLAVVLVLVYRQRALGFLVAFGGLAAIGFVVALRSARFARLLDFSSGTNFARIRVWQSATNVIRDHPLLGIGPDQFLYAFRGRYILPDAWKEPNLSHPHNMILDFWVRMGVFGVLVFVWIQVAFWRVMLRAYHRLHEVDAILYALVVGTMGSMANMLSHGVVDNSIYVHDLAYVFVLLLGLAMALSNTRAIDEAEEMMV